MLNLMLLFLLLRKIADPTIMHLEKLGKVPSNSVSSADLYIIKLKLVDCSYEN